MRDGFWGRFFGCWSSSVNRLWSLREMFFLYHLCIIRFLWKLRFNLLCIFELKFRQSKNSLISFLVFLKAVLIFLRTLRLSLESFIHLNSSLAWNKSRVGASQIWLQSLSDFFWQKCVAFISTLQITFKCVSLFQIT